MIVKLLEIQKIRVMRNNRKSSLERQLTSKPSESRESQFTNELTDILDTCKKILVIGLTSENESKITSYNLTKEEKIMLLEFELSLLR